MNSTNRMPLLFIGHGSPMNAIEENDYTRALIRLSKRLPLPKAILVVSAHWLTEGTFVTELSAPKTIHDFFGFPQELFDFKYPVPGSIELAKQIQEMIVYPKINADHSWGLDHGAWTILKHMYPEANVPVLQLSLNISQPADYHYNLGRQLTSLRDQGVLIIASGNIVHNLRQIRWESDAGPYAWAIDFDEWIKKKLIERDFNSIMYDFNKTIAGKLSVPTLEHYCPLYYILGATSRDDILKFEYEEIQNGSISMRSFSLS